ncbi:MAG TPA: hypothetical protein VE684_22025 [Crenalkalicoccus sp.]|jgi:hypothetical protein|nr:hypothetical protein [Crenalkalicoccus sp.]
MRRLPALLILLPVAAAAQPPVPMCLAQREGMVACFADKLCTCRFDPGGSLAARPPGYRWDCGPLRPDCGVVPPTVGAPPAALLMPEVTPVLPAPQAADPFAQPGATPLGRPSPGRVLPR